MGHGLSAARADTGKEQSGALEVHELHLEGDRRIGRSALVLSPKEARPDERLGVLVLLHGLGETTSEQLGLHAWSDRYGLVEADLRLRHPPVRSRNPRRYLPEARASQIDVELAAHPYRGLVFVCPVTPNIYSPGLAPQATTLDRYADWIDGVLLPAVRASVPVARTDAAGTAIDGCSLGGYVALEVFLRKPGTFGALGGVQTAIGEASAIAHAERLREAIDRVGPRGIHIESSSWDPSLSAHLVMSKRLRELGVPHDLDVLPGGHDQIFLREIGTLEMVLWHARRLPVTRVG